MCLDAVLVDNSQTSEGFESIREVFSAPGFSTSTPQRSLARTEARQTYTMLEASRLVVLLRVCCSLAVRFWSCWIVDHGTEQLKLINWVASTVFYLACLTMLVTVEYDIVIPMSHDFSRFERERAPKNLHGHITSSTQAAKSIQRHPRA